jgi:hypothetical protein
MSAFDIDPVTALPRMAWLHRFVQAFRAWRRGRLERRAVAIGARLERIEIAREVMKIFGEDALKIGSGFIVEIIMDRMEAERSEHGRLSNELAQIEKSLNR